MKIAVMGNCQVQGISQCLRIMAPDCEIVAVHLGINLNENISDCDVIVVMSDFRHIFNEGGPLSSLGDKHILSCPTFYFPAFHPDLVYVNLDKGVAQSPIGDYQSSIIFYAWTKGFDVDKTESLFCEPVFENLKFFDYWETSKQALLDDIRNSDIDLDGAFDLWAARGCFAHSVNHPKLFVLSSIAEGILRKLGIVPTTRRPETFLHDMLSDSCVWPVYPAIARRLGIEGDYAFKVSRHLCTEQVPIRILSLRDYIYGSLKYFDVYPREELRCDRLINRAQMYEGIEDIAAAKPARRAVQEAVPVAKRADANPYSALPDFCFWRKGVARPAWNAVDPVVQTKFQLASTDRIATAGSCFAQHIAKTLLKNGYNYYVTETAPESLSSEQAVAGNYGQFSARYGNIYTARQLVQLFDRAYGRFAPRDTVWNRRDGRFIDPFRPQVEADGFPSAEAVIAARQEHFAAVRRMSETTDVFVFTLGLTESWRAKSEGAVFPVAPEVVATGLNGNDYEFINFNVADIREDMRAFIAKLRAVNPKVRVVITVSPVPLVATYERRHVLVSTTYSKSVLRVVAGEIADEFDFVDYFPSYEIITGNFNRGQYFQDDLREVKPEGVDHVMRLFKQHFFHSIVAQPPAPIDATLKNEIRCGAKVLCDEELLDQPACV